MHFCSFYKSKYDPFNSVVAIGGTDTLQVLIKLKSTQIHNNAAVVNKFQLALMCRGREDDRNSIVFREEKPFESLLTISLGKGPLFLFHRLLLGQER